MTLFVVYFIKVFQNPDRLFFEGLGNIFSQQELNTFQESGIFWPIFMLHDN